MQLPASRLASRWTTSADRTHGTTSQISLPERSDDTPLQDLAPHSYEPAPTEDPEEAAVGADIETSSLLRAPSPSPAAADGYGVAGAASVNHDSELHSPLSASSAAPSGSHAAHLRNNISTLLSPQTVSPTLLLLYSNAITSLIGLCTLVLLWIPIPLLHWIGLEEFQVPPKEAGLAMVGIILGGIGTSSLPLGVQRLLQIRAESRSRYSFPPSFGNSSLFLYRAHRASSQSSTAGSWSSSRCGVPSPPRSPTSSPSSLSRSATPSLSPRLRP